MIWKIDRLDRICWRRVETFMTGYANRSEKRAASGLIRPRSPLMSPLGGASLAALGQLPLLPLLRRIKLQIVAIAHAGRQMAQQDQKQLGRHPGV